MDSRWNAFDGTPRRGVFPRSRAKRGPVAPGAKEARSANLDVAVLHDTIWHKRVRQARLGVHVAGIRRDPAHEVWWCRESFAVVFDNEPVVLTHEALVRITGVGDHAAHVRAVANYAEAVDLEVDDDVELGAVQLQLPLARPVGVLSRTERERAVEAVPHHVTRTGSGSNDSVALSGCGANEDRRNHHR